MASGKIRNATCLVRRVIRSRLGGAVAGLLLVLAVLAIAVGIVNVVPTKIVLAYLVVDAIGDALQRKRGRDKG